MLLKSSGVGSWTKLLGGYWTFFGLAAPRELEEVQLRLLGDGGVAERRQGRGAVLL